MAFSWSKARLKIAITGHSKGIGKSIFDLLNKEHNCIGFSRSNGYDISIDAERIIDSAKECDVFINNAYKDLNQVVLFDKLFELWKDDNTKQIINIGSKSKYYPFNDEQPQLRKDKRSSKAYNDNKKSITHSIYSKQMYLIKKCKIITIHPGYTKTDFIKHHWNNINMINPEDVAEIVKWVLSLPKHIEIGELGVWHPTEIE